MDPNPYQFAYSFEPVVFPEPMSSSPPSIQFQWQTDEYTSYPSSYDYSVVSPSDSSSGTGSSQSLAESQAPIVSFSSSTLTDALALPPVVAEVDDTVSISTIFHPEALPSPDTIFASSDGVIFYERLSAPLSDPKFRTNIVELDAPSLQLNVILHTVYGTSAEAHSPDIETLVEAVDRMQDYGLPPQSLIRSSAPLYELLLSKAPLHPLDVYALAAHHDLLPLAVIVSSHLLSCDLFSITDAMAERITPIYLKRLIAYLVWDSRPDLSVHRIQSTLNPLIEHVTCGMCRQVLNAKVKDVLVRWASVKVPLNLSYHFKSKVEKGTRNFQTLFSDQCSACHYSQE
ncbi:hypothetical protein CPB84DRAFT_1766880 [Gymnopilus junonius]|uniref:Uncharacterized protein n=1 Tax=Gymnopilus junonius TaxID=109634 RepID=A0A9P5NYU1_GYMJU|nr:hypothetical protein CPB84DRAFT_1766880 [Gymnopilus junonius]